MKKMTKQQIDSMYKDGRFTKFENNIMLKIILDCGSSCAILYMVLLMHKNNNNPHGCYPTYDTLMSECNMCYYNYVGFMCSNIKWRERLCTTRL